MNKTLLVLAISGLVLGTPMALAQTNNNALPKLATTETAPTRAVPQRSNTGITASMRPDMMALASNLAIIQEQMATINSTTDIATRQKLMKEQMLSMREHMHAMQTALRHMAEMQVSTAAPGAARASLSLNDPQRP